MGPGRFVILAFVVASFLTVMADSLARAQPKAEAEKIEAKVWKDLETQGTVTLFTVMKEQADTGGAKNIPDWNARGQAVVDTLTEIAARTQRPLLQRLAARGAEAQPFWIVNSIRVITQNASLIRELSAREDVAYIKSEARRKIPEPQPGRAEPKTQAVEWGVARVRAPEVWEQFNVRGEGIVVANIDTGVQFDHPALVRQYRGRRPDGEFDHNYNWHDPSRVCGNPSLAPCDNDGHGTHTMGTMVGDDGEKNQIGVAPGAQWIAAKGCERADCSDFALLSSGQWVLAPTDLKGQNPRADLRPHVVNNSWADDGGFDPFYRGVITNWVNAGIFPAFANGNDGPTCGWVSVPGAYPEAFGVGATNNIDEIISISGRGPARFFDNITKPNATAPGDNVRSSTLFGRYEYMSGTSMATPHVAGTVALAWAASPELRGDISGTFDLLQTTARFRPSDQCGPEGPPNNVYGWGIIDALAAVEQAVTGQTRLSNLRFEISDSIEP